MRMIELDRRLGHFAHRFDLQRSVWGREDDTEVVEACISELHRRTVDAGWGNRAAAARASIQKASLQTRLRGGMDPVRLAVRVKQLEATVDRLLSFVPPRTTPVDEDVRIGLAERLGKTARGEFGDRSVQMLWTDEADPTSSAAHRLTIIIDASGMSPDDFAEGSSAVHGEFAAALEPTNRLAVRLIVQPVQSNDPN